MRVSLQLPQQVQFKQCLTPYYCRISLLTKHLELLEFYFWKNQISREEHKIQDLLISSNFRLI